MVSVMLYPCIFCIALLMVLFFLYIVFVDLMKAFDSVGRIMLWQLLRKYGCPRKFHNHDKNSVYRNDGQRQEWRVGLGYIFYNKRCQAVVRTGSHAFLYLSISRARRGF